MPGGLHPSRRRSVRLTNDSHAHAVVQNQRCNVIRAPKRRSAAAAKINKKMSALKNVTRCGPPVVSAHPKIVFDHTKDTHIYYLRSKC